MTKFFRYALLLLFLGLPGWADTPPPSSATVKVGYVPFTVEGDYQPLDSATTNDLLLKAFKEAAPDFEFVPVNLDNVPFNADQAYLLAKAQGFDLIAWGTVSYEIHSQTSRDLDQMGRLKYLITAIGDIQVSSVARMERVLTMPTSVTSTDLSDAFTETGDPQLAKRLAKESLQDVGETIIAVLRQRGDDNEAESL